MNLHPHLSRELARYHQQEMRAAAERHRLARLARPAARPSDGAEWPGRLRRVLTTTIRPVRRSRQALASVFSR